MADSTLTLDAEINTGDWNAGVRIFNLVAVRSKSRRDMLMKRLGTLINLQVSLPAG